MTKVTPFAPTTTDTDRLVEVLERIAAALEDSAANIDNIASTLIDEGGGVLGALIAISRR
jgi:hypothetical protein